MNSPMHNRRVKKNKYIVRVTSINHSETKNNTGIPNDNVWVQQDFDYGIAIRGLRIDFTNNPTITAIIPYRLGGDIDYPNIGDYVIVEENVGGLWPFVVGVVHSLSQLSDVDVPPEVEWEKDTWDNGVKNFSRPMAPTLESPGNRGRQYNYNPVYMTYHEKYTDDRATEPYFGAWYDRFVLFDSSETYKNKKPFITFNESWIREGLASDQKGWQDILLYMLDNVSNPKKLEDYFYLEEGRQAYRPDPVFDTTSGDHQLLESDPILRNELGGTDIFSAATPDNWDQYPMPQRLQPDYENEKLELTAYDEVINDILSKIRKNSRNIANADLPYEPKEEKQIRIGRNKLVIADMHGDGKSIMMTLKTAADQQMTMMFNDNGQDKLSQLRLRGFFGESLLIESYGSSKADAASRFTYKGLDGQLVEAYDNAETSQNYIYLMSSEGSEMQQDYTLNRGSYFLLANDTVPSASTRVLNNSHIDEVNVGRLLSYGIYDNEYFSTNHVYYDGTAVYSQQQTSSENSPAMIQDTKYLNLSSNEISHSVVRQSANSIYFNDEFTVNSSNALHTRQATSGSSFVRQTYDAANMLYRFENNLLSYMEIFGDTAMVYAPTRVHVDSPNVQLGDGGGTVARFGDPVFVAGLIGQIGASNSAPPIPNIKVTA